MLALVWQAVTERRTLSLPACLCIPPLRCCHSSTPRCDLSICLGRCKVIKNNMHYWQTDVKTSFFLGPCTQGKKILERSTSSLLRYNRTRTSLEKHEKKEPRGIGGRSWATKPGPPWYGDRWELVMMDYLQEIEILQLKLKWSHSNPTV